MLVRVYIDKGRVSETRESAETGISETPSEQYKQSNICKLTPALSKFPQLLLAANKENTY